MNFKKYFLLILNILIYPLCIKSSDLSLEQNKMLAAIDSCRDSVAIDEAISQKIKEIITKSTPTSIKCVHDAAAKFETKNNAKPEVLIKHIEKCRSTEKTEKKDRGGKAALSQLTPKHIQCIASNISNS